MRHHQLVHFWSSQLNVEHHLVLKYYFFCSIRNYYNWSIENLNILFISNSFGMYEHASTGSILASFTLLVIKVYASKFLLLIIKRYLYLFKLAHSYLKIKIRYNPSTIVNDKFHSYITAYPSLFSLVFDIILSIFFSKAFSGIKNISLFYDSFL